jgi:hypothetical protein
MRFAGCVRAALAVSAVAAVTGFAAEPEDPCMLTDWPGGYPIHRATDPRLVVAAREAFAFARAPMALMLCETKARNLLPLAIVLRIPENDDHQAYALVLVPQKDAYLYSEGALVAIIAHEAAHTRFAEDEACFVSKGFQRPPLSERLACELPVDALAASWIGASNMITALRELRKVAGPYFDPGSRADFEAEVDTRISALEERRTKGGLLWHR